MTYANIVTRPGLEAFCDDAAAAGVAGLIVPDLPVDEAAELETLAAAHGDRCRAAGGAGDDAGALRGDRRGLPRLRVLRGHVRRHGRARCAGDDRAGGRRGDAADTDLPLLVGVGIATPAHAKAACAFADGVVVGSALMARLLEDDRAGMLDLAAAFRSAVGAGVDADRRGRGAPKRAAHARRDRRACDRVRPRGPVPRVADAHHPGDGGGHPDDACRPPATRGVGVKLVTLSEFNPQKGLPFVQATYVLFDVESQRPEAVIDGTELTAIRTAAVSGLATDLLARQDASRLVLFGAGVQATAHLEAMRVVRPVEEVVVVSRGADRAEALVARAAALGLSARVGVPEDVSTADLVCTCTTSAVSVFQGEDLAAGRPRQRDRRVVAASARARHRDDPSREGRGRDAARGAGRGGRPVIPIGEGAIDAGHIRADLTDLARGAVRADRPLRHHGLQVRGDGLRGPRRRPCGARRPRMRNLSCRERGSNPHALSDTGF